MMILELFIPMKSGIFKILKVNVMILSKCCDAEVKFGMVDDHVGHGMHEETECSNCGELFPEVYDDEEED